MRADSGLPVSSDITPETRDSGRLAWIAWHLAWKLSRRLITII